ncbi:MAG TPA: hypothetical protein VF525_14325, partial [Pyrinomonadaceae bacterium]
LFTSWEYNPSWSSDDSQIVFQSDLNGGGYSEIYRMDANGNNITRLTFNMGTATNPDTASDMYADWQAL